MGRRAARLQGHGEAVPVRKKRLTPEQTERVNRTLRYLANDLERKRLDREAEELAQSITKLCQELATA